MLFNSLEFLLIFLPLTLAVSVRLRSTSLMAWITFTSFAFYAFAGHIWFLIPMGFTTIFDFFLARKIESAKSITYRRIFLAASLAGNLGLLVYFKYSKLLLTTANNASVTFFGSNLPVWTNTFEVILPAGISFYTFQTLSYIIDVYRGHCHVEKSFLKFNAFVTFFPHLIAGPLTRHNQLIPQLSSIEVSGIIIRWREGIYLFAIGLAKKVLIADRIANYIDPMLSSGNMDMTTAWLTMLGYTLQIYFDFSGYSDMAIGLGRLFNIELPQNFNSPYQALNPSDFWRRWHMSLSAWLRDYLYISLGGNRYGSLRRNFALFATMFLGGLWHGASWTFAAWGAYHGFLLIAYHYGKGTWDKLPIGVQKITTFLLVCFGWILFRSVDFQFASNWFLSLFAFKTISSYVFFSIPKPLLILIAIGICIASFFANASRRSSFNLSPLRQVALGALTVLAIVYMQYSSKFLYFQF
jgi:alginate O-acetyltransferase complex protein AlgI